jgi:hypothetical protein
MQILAEDNAFCSYKLTIFADPAKLQNKYLAWSTFIKENIHNRLMTDSFEKVAALLQP